MARTKATPQPADFFSTMLGAAEQSTGMGGVYTAAQHGEYFWGISLQHLPLQWLVGGLNILPYGSVVEIAGAPGSLKSSLAIELLRMACDADGLGVYMDVESKTGPILLPMIAGRRYTMETRQIHHVPNLRTIEGWQQAVNEYLKLQTKNDPGGLWPMMIVVDSLTAKMTDEEFGKFEKEGQAQSRGYAVGAMAITRFMKGWPASVLRQGDYCRPVILVGINHLKEETAGPGYTTYYTPGGKGKDFQCSLRLWTRAKGRTDLGAATLNDHMPRRLVDTGVQVYGTGDRRTIIIKGVKSSLGPDWRELEVDYYWGWNEDSTEQYSWFDWSGALALMLAADTGTNEFIKVRGKARRYMVWRGKEKVLDNASATRAGEYVESLPEVMSGLYRHYHIQRRKVHAGGIAAVACCTPDD